MTRENHLPGRATRLTRENHLPGRLPVRVTPRARPQGTPHRPMHRPTPRKAWEPTRKRVFGQGAVDRSKGRYGNINPFIHSTTPVGLALGPDSPRDDERGPGTLRLTQGRRTWPWNPWSSSGKDPHLALATHVCILTPIRSTTGSLRGFNPAWDALLPNNHKGCCRVFGGVLEPRYIVGAEPLDQ